LHCLRIARREGVGQALATDRRADVQAHSPSADGGVRTPRNKDENRTKNAQSSRLKMRCHRDLPLSGARFGPRLLARQGMAPGAGGGWRRRCDSAPAQRDPYTINAAHAGQVPHPPSRARPAQLLPASKHDREKVEFRSGQE
jgi:hypothetical protein